MWPFKKKTPEPTTVSAKSILCIPGNWADREQLLVSLVAHTHAEYLLVGNILMHAKTKRHFTIEFCERDDQMKASFSVAGKVTGITENTLEDVDRHTFVLYICGETSGLEEAEHLARAATAVLGTGGAGIKIESAGKAFSKEKWLALMSNFQPHLLYEMFVVDSILCKDGSVFSCGMHNLGLKDTIVSNETFQDAVDLIKTYSYYQIVDNPVIRDNQTFQSAPEAPARIFRITSELNPPYEGHETFHNPYGMWRLSKIGSQG